MVFEVLSTENIFLDRPIQIWMHVPRLFHYAEAYIHHVLWCNWQCNEDYPLNECENQISKNFSVGALYSLRLSSLLDRKMQPHSEKKHFLWEKRVFFFLKNKILE